MPLMGTVLQNRLHLRIYKIGLKCSASRCTYMYTHISIYTYIHIHIQPVLLTLHSVEIGANKSLFLTAVYMYMHVYAEEPSAPALLMML